MAIIGVGIDVVDLARFAESLRAHARAARAAVHPGRGATRPLASLAARFAAKEALAKALGAPGDLAWHDAEVRLARRPAGRCFELRGTVAARADELGVAHVHLSLSHDAGIASAVGGARRAAVECMRARTPSSRSGRPRRR